MAERIVIGGWSFDSPCCQLDDIAGVYTVPTFRGDDRVIPGVEGEEVRTRVKGPVFFNLTGFIVGEVDKDGAAHADPRVGLKDNWEAMLAAVLPPGMKTITHHLNDDSSRSADCWVTVEGPDASDIHMFTFGLQVKIPAGGFTDDIDSS